MRVIAVVPLLLCTASFVLAFLCLFAGSRKGWMEDYAVITLNTSRIGQNLFNTSESSDNPIVNIWHNLTNSIESGIQDALTSYARDLGLHDWYSYHLLTYCEGDYEPGPVPNATLPKSDIRENVTYCSNRTALHSFDVQEILQRELNEKGADIDLADLGWSDSIQRGLNALRVLAKATFVLYCIAIGVIGIALIAAAVAFFRDGRLSALLNVALDMLAFLVFGIASAVATAVGVKAARVINKYGNEIGLSATKGTKFLILSWIGTGLLLVASVVWCFDCVVGGRRRARSSGPKYG